MAIETNEVQLGEIDFDNLPPASADDFSEISKVENDVGLAVSKAMCVIEELPLSQHREALYALLSNVEEELAFIFDDCDEPSE